LQTFSKIQCKAAFGIITQVESKKRKKLISIVLKVNYQNTNIKLNITLNRATLQA